MTEEMRNFLREKIYAELDGLRQNVVDNYQDNMANRENNPFLVIDDIDAKKYMALGRSIDSQLGNRLQRIIFLIARMRYGIEKVPNVVEINIANKSERNIKCILYSVDCNLPLEEQKSGFNPYRQYIYINKASTTKQIKNLLKIRASSPSLVKSEFEFDNISHSAMKAIKKKEGKKLPVDLLFFDCSINDLNNANAFEIKMGGNLDTKNSESNAKEVRELSELFSFLTDHSAYFATCYAECSTAVKRDLEEILGDNTICNNRDFWDKIIPLDDFTYDDFISIYTEAFRAINLENLLEEL